MISWLAGKTWRMEAFANGEDIYCACAAKMFGVPVEKNGINGHLRQKGKIAELACGYGGSIGAIKAMGGTELNLTDDELYSIVEDWRKSSPNIVKLWNDVQSVAVKVITDQSSMTFGRLKFSYQTGILFIELSSGRRLVYGDDVIVECTPDTTVEQVCSLMETTTAWAKGPLLRADGYECEFYMKQ